MLSFLAGFQFFPHGGSICLNKDLQLRVLVPFLKIKYVNLQLRVLVPFLKIKYVLSYFSFETYIY